MDEPFFIPVNYKGADREFQATLQILGYIHRFRVLVGEMEVFFERDEEGNYRAIIPPEELEKSKAPDAELLGSIASAIEQILK